MIPGGKAKRLFYIILQDFSRPVRFGAKTKGAAGLSAQAIRSSHPRLTNLEAVTTLKKATSHVYRKLKYSSAYTVMP